MADTKEKIELKTLTSFKDLQNEGPALQLDLEDDAWSYGAPPPKGLYEVKWFAVKDGIKYANAKKDDPSSLYLQISIEGRIINNPEWNDAVVYEYLDSRVFRGKQTSKMITFLVKGGQKGAVEKNAPMTAKKSAQLVEMFLKKEPIIRAEIDWKGSYKYTDSKTGEEKYENVYNKYEDFPVDQEDKSKRIHMVTLTGKDGNSHEIRAMVKVNRMFGKDEVYSPTKLVNQPKGVSSVAVPLLVDEPETSSIKLASNVNQVQSTTVAAQADEEFLLEA